MNDYYEILDDKFWNHEQQKVGSAEKQEKSSSNDLRRILQAVSLMGLAYVLWNVSRAPDYRPLINFVGTLFALSALFLLTRNSKRFI